ncbi:PAS/PAC and GAF sensor-containing diguanylate cyclase/phosphodiesterase [Salinisphaera sp. T5B8]|uniref:sensor domain-containing phosphodiesterase n=1 Tax=Salinisphaera sp. T5B8 TaxID=1304154 RepID=UPI00334276E3
MMHADDQPSSRPGALRAIEARSFDDLAALLPELCRAAAELLDVARVSVWLFGRDLRRLNQIHVHPHRREIAGRLVLDVSPQHDYIASLDRTGTFCMTDAAALSPASRDLFADYLEERSIVAMLDAAIVVRGQLVGVLCHEHHRVRQWRGFENTWARRFAAIIATTIERARERATQSDDRRFRQVVDAAQDAIALSTPKGTLEYLNPAARHALGLAPDEPLGKRAMQDLLAASGQSRLRERVFADLGRVGVWSGTLALPGVDGQSLDVAVNVQMQGGDSRHEPYLIWHIGDFAQQLELGRQIAEVRSRYETTFASTGESLFHVDARGRILDTDEGFRRMLGYTHDQHALLTLQDLSETHAAAGIEHDLMLTRQTGHHLCGERRLKHASGHWVIVQLSMVRAGEGGHEAITVRLRDISELVAQRDEMERLAYYDPLTGLANSNLLRDSAERMLVDSVQADRQLSFVLLKVERWERILDSHGYHVAEGIIREIGQRLTAAFKHRDVLLARVLNGLEIGLLFDQKAESLEHVIASANAAFHRTFCADQDRIQLSVRSGSAQAPRDAVNFKDLSRCAGLALRRAGRASTRHCRYELAHSSRIKDDRLLEDDLRKALTSSELSLCYQPIRAVVRNDAWSAVEALMRWQHPQLGAIAPDDFIALAEESGLVVDLDRRALSEGCQAAVDWRDTIGPVRVSVNMSALTLMDPRVVDMVHEVLEQSGLRPDRLCIEVTETAVMRDRVHAAAVLEQLHALGVFIALDDFGTGYSSLAYLKYLPVDVLKIDRDFINGIGTDNRDERTIQAIIRLGHDLGLHVVAEGVETRRQYRWLAEHSVEFVQGYYLARPMPIAALLETGVPPAL